MFCKNYLFLVSIALLCAGVPVFGQSAKKKSVPVKDSVTVKEPAIAGEAASTGLDDEALAKKKSATKNGAKSEPKVVIRTEGGKSDPENSTEAAPEEALVAPEEDEHGHAHDEPPPPLTAREVVVVANFSHPHSTDLAKHYINVRGIPANQLLVTGMPLTETISRKEYEDLIATPLKDFLTKEKLDHVRCVVLIYGVPLKVLEPGQSDEERRMGVMVNDERETSLKALIEIVGRVKKLSLAPGSPEPEPLAFDPHAPAKQQIAQLHEAVLKAFQEAGKFINGLEPGDVRQRLAGQWWESWRKAFGEYPPPGGLMTAAPGPPVSMPERLERLKRMRDLLNSKLNTETLRRFFDLYTQTHGPVGVMQIVEKVEQRIKPDWTWRAAVDSELATLFWEPFPLARYVSNPLQLNYHGEPPGRTLMVCRLDGPSDFIVRGMIDTSVAVEKRGLTGKAYIDARGRKGDSAYGIYDEDLVHLGTTLKRKTKIQTVVDAAEELFQPGQCPDAALYAGWYSMSKYVDAFSFAPGAVGFHLASTEAMTLRTPGSQLWCPQLLANGVVATMGPVEEPFLTSFPKPSMFFALLLAGNYSLVECYTMTLPNLSWMMTLIGDPLYKPFAVNPALKSEDFEEGGE